MNPSDDGMAAMADKEAISQVIKLWTYYRDRQMWDQLRTTFHPEGTISSLWFEGQFKLFVDASKLLAEKGDTGKHVMGIPYIRIKDNRALSETDVTILVRQKIKSMELDLTSYVRFYDFLEKRNGSWKICKRTVIYEKDRLDPVQPSARFWLASLFSRVGQRPASYRYLGYGMERRGAQLAPNVTTHSSKEASDLYQAGEQWLSQG